MEGCCRKNGNRRTDDRLVILTIMALYGQHAINPGRPCIDRYGVFLFKKGEGG
jgi:hypothetical protein